MGARAPALSVTDDAGQGIDFGAELAEGITVVSLPDGEYTRLYREPVVWAPDIAGLRQRGVQVFGVSGDSVARKASSAKICLTFSVNCRQGSAPKQGL